MVSRNLKTLKKIYITEDNWRTRTVQTFPDPKYQYNYKSSPENISTFLKIYQLQLLPYISFPLYSKQWDPEIRLFSFSNLYKTTLISHLVPWSLSIQQDPTKEVNLESNAT